MSIYIPVIVFQILAFWPLVGLILFVPIAMWQNRFVSGNHPWHQGLNYKIGIPAVMVAWPVMLGYCVKTEISYRRKGLL